MAYQVPPIPVPPNPVFIDASVVEIQQELGTLTWLTYSFGRSYAKDEMRSGTQRTAPFVYQGQAEYLPVEFNDNLQALSFFQVGNQTPLDYESHRTNFYEVPVNIIFWANLRKIDSVKGDDYYFAEQLKKDVRNLLTNMNPKLSRFEIEEIIENKDEIFDEYSFTEIERQYFSYPYVAFRFDLTLTIEEVCP
jgi:hypothetical protein